MAKGDYIRHSAAFAKCPKIPPFPNHSEPAGMAGKFHFHDTPAAGMVALKILVSPLEGEG